MSTLGQVLRSLHNADNGGLESDRVCVQLLRDCRHAEQHMQGLSRQCQQLGLDIEQARGQLPVLQQQRAEREQAALTALAAGEQERAHQLATDLAREEDRLDASQLALTSLLKRQSYYQSRWLSAERHYHDLCRQLTMAKNTACVRKTMTAIRRHPAVTLINAKQALADIRAREQQQAADVEPEATPATTDVRSADQVLARLQQQLRGRS
ncbi:hypothetical protein [Oceanisphaera arctica]|uniref:Phage shock protein A n=1 Tax=Oceanisphaera arctica TaxID=641510 RepID=A0A2P5TPB7_9GAMM|nr:hypothetical protein [Oceanisphaera arctica]PPL17456.1 hypothetical protein UN63_05330 [Oceanisphaera arctica]GHA07864.1 hypothetical protein GCM10007082_05940 [Oceanisphaera arctica]